MKRKYNEEKDQIMIKCKNFLFEPEGNDIVNFVYTNGFKCPGTSGNKFEYNKFIRIPSDDDESSEDEDNEDEDYEDYEDEDEITETTIIEEASRTFHEVPDVNEKDDDFERDNKDNETEFKKDNETESTKDNETEYTKTIGDNPEDLPITTTNIQNNNPNVLTFVQEANLQNYINCSSSEVVSTPPITESNEPINNNETNSVETDVIPRSKTPENQISNESNSPSSPTTKLQKLVIGDPNRYVIDKSKLINLMKTESYLNTKAKYLKECEEFMKLKDEELNNILIQFHNNFENEVIQKSRTEIETFFQKSEEMRMIAESEFNFRLQLQCQIEHMRQQMMKAEELMSRIYNRIDENGKKEMNMFMNNSDVMNNSVVSDVMNSVVMTPIIQEQDIKVQSSYQCNNFVNGVFIPYQQLISMQESQAQNQNQNQNQIQIENQESNIPLFSQVIIESLDDSILTPSNSLFNHGMEGIQEDSHKSEPFVLNNPDEIITEWKMKFEEEARMRKESEMNNYKEPIMDINMMKEYPIVMNSSSLNSQGLNNPTSSDPRLNSYHSNKMMVDTTTSTMNDEIVDSCINSEQLKLMKCADDKVKTKVDPFALLKSMPNPLAEKTSDSTVKTPGNSSNNNPNNPQNNPKNNPQNNPQNNPNNPSSPSASSAFGLRRNFRR